MHPVEYINAKKGKGAYLISIHAQPSQFLFKLNPN